MNLVVTGAILVTLLAIVASLGAGLVFMFKDQSASRRTANALTVRITLSVILFLLLFVGLLTGVVVPNKPF